MKMSGSCTTLPVSSVNCVTIHINYNQTWSNRENLKILVKIAKLCLFSYSLFLRSNRLKEAHETCTQTKLCLPMVIFKSVCLSIYVHHWIDKWSPFWKYLPRLLLVVVVTVFVIDFSFILTLLVYLL